MELAQVTVYPVKSCRGFTVERWPLVDTGLRHDREFMIADPAGRFLTQRELPAMALIGTAITGGVLTLTVPGSDAIRIPLADRAGAPRPAEVWGEDIDAFDQGEAAAAALTSFLGRACRLLRVARPRPVDPRYAPIGATVGFADGFPLLLIGQASLDDLNTRLERALPMNRFRPNLVVAGAEPYAEDGWRRIRIGDIDFDVVKPCARCTITTVDQDTGRRDGAEPLRALGRFRRGERGVLFGQNLVHRGTGDLAVGDVVQPHH